MGMIDEKPLLAAVDAGGTKTAAVLFDINGNVVKKITTAGINPLVTSFDDAKYACAGILRDLKEESNGRIAAIYIGMPGLQYFGNKMQESLREEISFAKIEAEADGYMQISAMLGSDGDGAALVCGTGSGLYIREKSRKYGIGGWGYIIDGCGSGFVLGRRAIRAAIRQSDGRGETTLVTDLVNAKIGGDVTKHIPELYAGGRPFFASFAETVFEARKAGDKTASRIFSDCAGDLAEMVNTGFHQSHIRRLVLNGGIFMHYPEYVGDVMSRVSTEIETILSDCEPIYGGALEAMRMAGAAVQEDFKQNFVSTFSKS